LIRDHGSYSYGIGNLLWLIVGNLVACFLACSSTHVQPGAMMPVAAEGFIPLLALAVDFSAVYAFLGGTKFGMHSVPLIFLALMAFLSPMFDVPASYFRTVAVGADLLGVLVLVHLFFAIADHIRYIERKLPPDILADLRAQEAG
jgi:hypothetical protein